MKRAMMVAMLACGLAAVSSVRGDEPATKPSKPDTTGVRRARMTKPWSLLKSLTEEQKEKILDIRTEANAERKRIDQEEKEKIMALLSDEQKKELADAEAADKKSKKAGDPEEKKAD